MSGRARPVSIREISISRVPTCSARCSWVIPFSARAAFNLWFVAIVRFFVSVANSLATHPSEKSRTSGAKRPFKASEVPVLQGGAIFEKIAGKIAERGMPSRGRHRLLVPSVLFVLS
jgi:hypothetical protein